VLRSESKAFAALPGFSASSKLAVKASSKGADSAARHDSTEV
jgi:hypothetical protein